MCEDILGVKIYIEESVGFVSVPLPLGLRSHSTRLKVISLLSFSIMKFSVLLCQTLTTCFLSGVHLTSRQPVCLLAVHPSSLLTWQCCLSSCSRCGNLQKALKEETEEAVPQKAVLFKMNTRRFLADTSPLSAESSQHKVNTNSPLGVLIAAQDLRKLWKETGGLECFHRLFLWISRKNTRRDPWPTAPEKCNCRPILSFTPVDFICRTPTGEGIWGWPIDQ